MIFPVDVELVRPEWAERVVSPAYDALTPVLRQELAKANPYSYLNVTRSPGDIPGDFRPREELLAAGRASLDQLDAVGAFSPSPGPRFYIYRLDNGEHTQTGLVADIAVQAYLDGQIRIHEKTMLDRETLLARHLEVVGATSSPIALTYRGLDSVDELIDATTTNAPLVEFTSVDGLHQTVWVIDDDDVARQLSDVLAYEPLYIVDGHHRAGSAATFLDRHPGGRATAMLGVLFPTHQLRVLGYNRYVMGTGMTADELLARLSTDFAVREVGPSELTPQKVGDFGVCVEGRFFRIAPHRVRGSGPLASLDPAVLQEQILGPIFGIEDPSIDARLVHVSGALDPDEISTRVAADGGVGFVLFPVPIDALLAVADANGTMPPKSTYFAPKPRSGVFLRRQTPG